MNETILFFEYDHYMIFIVRYMINLKQIVRFQEMVSGIIAIFFIKHLSDFDLINVLYNYCNTVILLTYYFLNKVMKETDN